MLGNSLQLGKLYALELQVQDTRNNTANGAFPNVLSQSRTLLNFTIGGTQTAPQFLPIVDLTGPAPVYRFEGVPVIAGQTVLIDPDVAVGYDYQVAVGNPLFRSVTLPTGVGDGMFGLWLWDGTQWVDTELALAGGVEHLFRGMGLDRFRITGIEPEAGVNPYVAGSFTTGISFTDSGRFDGTMTALITTVVPEPASAVLAALGLVVVLAVRRRRNQRNRSPS